MIVVYVIDFIGLDSLY